MSFWVGFDKKAMEMLKWNALGGIDPRDPEAIARAQQSELKTLPADVEGANCSNCKWSRPLPDGTALCNNPSLMQEVTPRMICVLWEHPGVLYAATGEDLANDTSQPSPEEEAGQMDQAGAEMGLDDTEAAPAEGNDASQNNAGSGKKPEGGKEQRDNKITINVGDKAKQEKKASELLAGV